MGERGFQVMENFRDIRRNDYRIVAVCDCYEKRACDAKEWVDLLYKNSDCQAYARYEDVLDRQGIDVVVIATPDHWHTKIAVEACKAGKDVFCEKPLTLTPMESREIIAAARKYNRVCSSGSQRIIEEYGYMAPVVRSGALGEVKEAYVGMGGPPEDLYFPAEEIPPGLDWDRWLGPAPWVPYHWERYRGWYAGGWRRGWDYGNGLLADWGAHKLGAVMYFFGIDDQEPVEILPPHCEGNPRDELVWIFSSGHRIYHSQKDHDITLIGSEREYRHLKDRHRIKPIGPVDLRRYHGSSRTLAEDFAYCVRHRVRPFQDFIYGAATATACQLANIAYKLNRPLKWDAATTSFINDDMANRFVFRPKRFPYSIRY